MGEAERRKKAAVAAHPMLPRVVVERPKLVRLREYTITLKQEDDALLRKEHQHMQKKYPGLTLTGYISALVNAAVEQERMHREEQEASERLIIEPPKVGEHLGEIPRWTGQRTPAVPFALKGAARRA